jgi:hypothetical protein
MPNASVFCPACKRTLKTAEEPPVGARIRCPYADCGTVFHYNPEAKRSAEEAPASTVPVGSGDQYDLMQDLLAEEQGVASAKRNLKAGGQRANGAGEAASRAGEAISRSGEAISRSGEAISRSGEAVSRPSDVMELPRVGRSGSGSRIPRQPVAGHPLAQASARSKDALIGGKGVKFNEPRTYMGVFIGFLVLAAGYGAFLAFSTFFRYYNNTAQKRADDLAAKAKASDDAKRKRFDAAVAKVKAAQAAPAVTGAPAAPAAPVAPTISTNLAVSVESVRQGAFFPPDAREFLEIKLRISNESKDANNAATWPGPQVTARLRDTGFVPYQLFQGLSQDTKIAGGQSIRETIYFERTVPGRELTLELTIPGMPPQKLTIAPDAVQK